MEEPNEIKHVVEAMYKIMIAIQSLNPDPAQRIEDYRNNQRIARAERWATIGISFVALLISIYALFHTQEVGLKVYGGS